MFFEEHAKLLSDFARVSQAAGARADYVQGGGGNTSVKLPGGLMAIKASGFCLSDIRPDKAYAVLDGADLRNFYLTTEPSEPADVEKEGSARGEGGTLTQEGEKSQAGRFPLPPGPGGEENQGRGKMPWATMRSESGPGRCWR